MLSIKNMKVSTRLRFLVGAAVVGIVAIAVGSYFTIDRLKVNGPIDSEMTVYSDLNGAIVPPDLDIERVRYAVLKMMVDGQDQIPQDIELFKERKEAYLKANEAWKSRLPEGKMKDLITVDAFAAGRQYISEVEDELIPAAKKGDRKGMEEGFRKAGVEVTKALELTKQAVDLVTANRKKLDESADRSALQAIIILMSACVVVSLLVGILGLTIGRGVTNGADSAVRLAKGIAAGNLQKSETAPGEDEFGDLLRAMNQSIDAVNALVADANMLSKAAVEGKLSTRADASKHQGDFRKVVEGVNATLDAVIGPLNVAADYVDKISRGEIPPKITQSYNGDFNQIKDNLNTLIDSIQGLLAQMDHMSEQHDRGDIDVFIEPDNFRGAYGTMASGVNRMVQGHISVKRKAMACLAEFGKGNFDAPLEKFPGKKAFINENIEGLRTNLKHVAGELNGLIAATIDGKLSTRAKSDEFAGDWKRLMNSVNELIDAFVKPINVTADYVDKISKGTIPSKITDSYNGDFNLIKNNLNACIDGLGGLQEASHLAKRMSLNDLTIRMEGQYVGVFSELATSMNLAQDRVQHVVEIVKKVSAGNLEDLEELKKIRQRSEQDELVPSLTIMMESIQALIKDARALSQAAVEGKLETRADAAKHQGDFRKVVEGVNSTLDAVIGPLNVAAKYVDNISSGLVEASEVLGAMADNDYTRRVSDATRITKITDPYNGDFNTIKNNLNACVESLAGVGAATNKTADTVHASLKSIAQNAQALSSSSQQLAATSQQMSSNAEETSAQANTVASATQQVTTNLNSVATGAEEMTSTVQSISSNAGEAAKIASDAVRTANGANTTVAKLGESSAEIGQVIKVITSIAQQTNLLALNATIEAARAGEAGKGFAVVANEVKELAKQTAKATEDISQKITAIQDDTKRAVESIGSITGVINQINDISGTIATAVEEQSATTNEMSRNVQEAAKGSGEISHNIQGVATAAESTTRGAQDTLKAAQQLTEMASELRNLVDQFKLSEEENSAGTRAKSRAAHA